MRFSAPPLEGRLRCRYKRFFADVELPSGTVVTAHCPNTGSLLGCRAEGSRVWLRDAGRARRKLRYTWQAIEVDGTWVNVDTSLPNRVVHAAVAAGELAGLDGGAGVRREVPCGRGSRIDLLLVAAGGSRTYVEVKSTTLVEDGVALFPDAVTERGRRHLAALARAVKEGERAVQLFFVGRADAEVLRPAAAIDPAYADALRRAAAAGVEVRAWCARVEPEELAIAREIPVELEPPRRGRGRTAGR
ncbi:MAG: DNA/RNA nuclease SfsA [Planctomycetota bacterium]